RRGSTPPSTPVPGRTGSPTRRVRPPPVRADGGGAARPRPGTVSPRPGGREPSAWHRTPSTWRLTTQCRTSLRPDLLVVRDGAVPQRSGAHGLRRRPDTFPPVTFF